jgi:hypothetical protein
MRNIIVGVKNRGVITFSNVLQKPPPSARVLNVVFWYSPFHRPFYSSNTRGLMKLLNGCDQAVFFWIIRKHIKLFCL